MKTIKNTLYVLLAGLTLGSNMTSDASINQKYDVNTSYNPQASQEQMISRAEKELKEKGITSEQKKAHSILSQRAYNAIRPSIYNNANKTLELALEFAQGKNRFDIESVKKEYSKASALLEKYDKEGNYTQVDKQLKLIKNLDQKISDYSGHEDEYSEDAWKMYLGLPQTNKTFSISKYTPSKSKENTYYYSLPKEFEDELLSIVKKNKVPLNKINESRFENIYSETQSRARVLGNFKVDKGQDEKGEYISYYDRYDLLPEVPILGEVELDKFIGKPFEIYNRIYLK